MALEPTERRYESRSCGEITGPASPLLRSACAVLESVRMFVCLHNTELRSRCAAERRVPVSKHSKLGSVAKLEPLNELMKVKWKKKAQMSG